MDIGTRWRRLARARHLLLISLLGALVLASAACSGPSGAPASSTIAQAPTEQATTSEPAPSTADDTSAASAPSGITGTVSWPDGTPAANVSVIVYPTGFSTQGGDTIQTDSTGTYEYSGCPCNSVVAFAEVPHNSSNDPFNGGRDCWILMTSDSGFTGTSA